MQGDGDFFGDESFDAACFVGCDRFIFRRRNACQKVLVINRTRREAAAGGNRQGFAGGDSEQPWVGVGIGAVPVVRAQHGDKGVLRSIFGIKLVADDAAGGSAQPGRIAYIPSLNLRLGRNTGSHQVNRLYL